MQTQWTPARKSKEILDRCMEIVRGLPYTPTARYLFYRIYQEKGVSKDYYKDFLKLTSKARKNYYDMWQPDTLVDDSRGIAGGDHTAGYSRVDTFFSMQRFRSPLLAPHLQDNLVFVGFEAAAMMGQFNHYLGLYRVPLIPFKGDASIPFKWRIAQQIKTCAKTWPDKPIYFLYFGDYDPKGLAIPKSAMEDIRAWAGVGIDYIRVGLNEDQIGKYDIIDNPDKPGCYQWEAVPDEAAQELIEQVFVFWSKAALKATEELEDMVSSLWAEAVDKVVDKCVSEIRLDSRFKQFLDWKQPEGVE